VKDVSSTIIGSSPEFEMALFSLCWLHGEEHNIVQVRAPRRQRLC
jgi:hypothetical protein